MDVEPHPECIVKDMWCKQDLCVNCRTLRKRDFQRGLVDDPAAPDESGVQGDESRPSRGHDQLDGAFVDTVYSTFDAAAKLLLDKHAMYGAKNISQAPGGALNGLRVRMHDKLARLNNITDQGIKDGDVTFESLRDTLIDLGNYALIGVLVLDGKWPAA